MITIDVAAWAGGSDPSPWRRLMAEAQRRSSSRKVPLSPPPGSFGQSYCFAANLAGCWLLELTFQNLTRRFDRSPQQPP